MYINANDEINNLDAEDDEDPQINVDPSVSEIIDNGEIALAIPAHTGPMPVYSRETTS